MGPYSGGVCVSEMNATELSYPGRLQALLDDALAYERHLIDKKHLLRQRAVSLSAMLDKALP